MIHTAIRWGLVVLLVPALIFVATAPTDAFIDVTGPAILATLGTIGSQIAAQAAQLGTMIAVLRASDSKLGEHLEKVTMLASGQRPDAQSPSSDINQWTNVARQFRSTWPDLATFTRNTGLWIGDLNAAETQQLANRLTALGDISTSLVDHWRGAETTADTVDADDIGSLYGDPTQAQAAKEAWERMGLRAERQQVIDYHMLDSAEVAGRRLANIRQQIETEEFAEELSEDSLVLAELLLTNGETSTLAAMAASQENRALELARREALARWLQAERDARTQNDDSITWLQANARDMGRGLLLPTAFGPR